MADLSKATFFVRFKQSGYSFSFYQEQDSLKDMLKAAIELGKLVCPLFGGGVEMPFIRVSKENESGDSLFSEPEFIVLDDTSLITGNAQNSDSAIKAVISSAPDQGFTAAIVSHLNSATHKGRTFLRLIPDSITINGLGIVAPKKWAAAFVTLAEKLKSDQWGFLSLKRGGAYAPRIIKGVIGVQGSNVMVTVESTAGLTPGDTVRIGRVKSGVKVNGTYTVATISDATHLTLDFTDQLGNVSYVKGGTVRKQEKGFFPILESKILRITHRAAGRPFGVAVGRRPAKKK